MQADWLVSPAHSNQPYSTLLGTTTVSILTDYALLGCSGPDSARFLQGQLTCNVQEVDQTHSRPGAHCTPKGRMVSDFLLAQTGSPEQFFLRLHRETLAALQKALGKYIVFSKAKLRDASEEFLIVGLQGPDAEKTAKTFFGAAPESLHASHVHNDGVIIRVSTEPRFECWVAASNAQALWEALTQTLTVTGPGFWHWLNIRDGSAEIRGQTVEEFIPQMLNMQLTGGISFTKGCYTGQEIVARMQYRGTLKKSLYRFTGVGETPTPAIPVFQEGSEQPAGHIVMAETVDNNNWEALAVLFHDALEHPLYIGDHQTISRLPLPHDERM